MASVQYTMRFEEELFGKAKAQSKKEYRSFNNMVCYAVKLYVEAMGEIESEHREMIKNKLLGK